MELSVVDAFTDQPFAGNPAAVAIVDRFPPDERMQAIARELSLSETAFAVPDSGDEWELRWFTPAVEVDLCGHATLATAHIIGGDMVFHTRSGPLACQARRGWIEMDFPARASTEEPLPAAPRGFEDVRWSGVAGDDWLVELADPETVVALEPDLTAIAGLGRRCLVITAAARPSAGAPWPEGVDVVSRVFGPSVGIPEDPVTGSAHCALAPYWASRLGRTELVGYQASARGGSVRMRLDGDRVTLSGQAVTVASTHLQV